MKTGTKYHLVMTKNYLKMLILKDGADVVLSNFNGTDREAINHINKDAREVFTIAKCDNQDALGDCLGHKE